MIRAGYELTDVQKAVTDFLRYKVANSGAPWSSWTVVEGWPDQTVFANFTRLFLYSHTPLWVGEDVQQGGKGLRRLEMTIGGWSCIAAGGAEEAAIALSQLLALFGDPAVNVATFNSVIGGTAYTAKTFPQLGIYINDITNPRAIEFRDEDDFRGEVSLQITC